MTVLETAEKFHVAEETVINWCKKQWIRGVKKDDLGEYVIPKSVKMPYAKTRSKGDAIYTSIVKATLKGLDVTASLYDEISEQEFEKYIQQLKEAKVIDSYIDKSSGIEYLCQTLKSSEFAKLRKNKVKAFLSSMKPDVNINLGVNII